MVDSGTTQRAASIYVSSQDVEIRDLNNRIAELEAALLRIDEELVGSYGEIETMREAEVRRILRNIANIVHPSALRV